MRLRPPIFRTDAYQGHFCRQKNKKKKKRKAIKEKKRKWKMKRENEMAVSVTVIDTLLLWLRTIHKENG